MKKRGEGIPTKPPVENHQRPRPRRRQRPSSAPRGASIPCPHIRLRILPVTTGVAPSLPQPSQLCVDSALSATLYPEPRGVRYRLPLSWRPLCFHNDTNCFSRKAFIFTSIQIPRGCGGIRTGIMHRLITYSVRGSAKSAGIALTCPRAVRANSGADVSCLVVVACGSPPFLGHRILRLIARQEFGV